MARWLGWAVALAVLIAGCSDSRPGTGTGERPGLIAFKSDGELRAFLKGRKPRDAGYEDEAVSMEVAAPPEAASAPDSSTGITNVQEAGVDEGGIVKSRGDLLVILRRGRLFTVSTAGGGLRAVDSIEAYPPGVDPSEDWYDEMLLAEDRVVVIGFSYGRGGTEVNRFRIDSEGRLSFEDSHHIRANDYYSSRNYASRLIGSRLVLYTPLAVNWDGDPLASLPGVRAWQGNAQAPFKRIAAAEDIHVPPALRRRGASVDTVHSLISCDLLAPELACSATGVLGPWSRSFYVSPRAVYLWLSDPWEYDERRSGGPAWVYRLPLDGSAPGAVRARGQPVDQFSFREDAGDGVLNVLVRSEGEGDAMWAPERPAGSVALARIPLGAFGDGARELPKDRYRSLPTPEGNGYAVQNRFVGDWLLYGLGRNWESPGGDAGVVTAAPVRGGAAVTLRLPHSIDRIEALGPDALVAGGSGADLMLTSVELGAAPRVGDRHVRPNASEAETRSHAFFFKPDAPGSASGLMGLPVSRSARAAAGQLVENSAAVVFLRRAERAFSPLGELEARPFRRSDDGCRASCMDWYGNARPIFMGQRVFALMGYELVEGTVRDGAVREVERVDFRPVVAGGR